MHYTAEQNIPGLLLLIDFEKAFDYVSMTFIYKTLKYFGFSTSIISWIKLFSKKCKISPKSRRQSFRFFLHRKMLSTRRPCADDTYVILDISAISFNETLIVLSRYAKYPGLKITFDKTNVVSFRKKINQY